MAVRSESDEQAMVRPTILPRVSKDPALPHEPMEESELESISVPLVKQPRVLSALGTLRTLVAA